MATSPEALGEELPAAFGQHNSTTGRTCAVLITGRSRRCRRTELVPAGADRAERLCGVSGVSGGSDELSKRAKVALTNTSTQSILCHRRSTGGRSHDGRLGAAAGGGAASHLLRASRCCEAPFRRQCALLPVRDALCSLLAAFIDCGGRPYSCVADVSV